MTSDNFKLSWEIVPKQCDEPLGSEIVLPLISDEFLENLWMLSGLLMDPLEFLIQERP